MTPLCILMGAVSLACTCETDGILDHIRFNTFTCQLLASITFDSSSLSYLPLPSLLDYSSSNHPSSHTFNHHITNYNINMAPNSILSARDVEVLAAAFQCLKTPPDVRDSVSIPAPRSHSTHLKSRHSFTAQPATPSFPCAKDILCGQL